jgi:hypothetical protein
MQFTPRAGFFSATCTHKYTTSEKGFSKKGTWKNNGSGTRNGKSSVKDLG